MTLTRPTVPVQGQGLSHANDGHLNTAPAIHPHSHIRFATLAHLPHFHPATLCINAGWSPTMAPRCWQPNDAFLPPLPSIHFPPFRPPYRLPRSTHTHTPLLSLQPSSAPPTPTQPLNPSTAHHGLASRVRRAERAYQKMILGCDALIFKVGPTPHNVALCV
jgi:hypothetical protein